MGLCQFLSGRRVRAFEQQAFLVRSRRAARRSEGAGLGRAGPGLPAERGAVERGMAALGG